MLLLLLLSAVSSSLVGHLIAHDAVVKLTMDGNYAHKAALEKFKPFIKNDGQCVPFAAVDAQGQIGHGLRPTGFFEGSGCDHSEGQLYSRVGSAGGVPAIMFATYYPKEQWGWRSGQRHLWIHFILWFKDTLLDGYPRAISLSEDAYTYDTSFNKPYAPLTTRVSIRKQGKSFKLDWGGDALGQDLPLIDWDSMPIDAREALNTFSWGGQFDQACPFNDDNFQSNLDLAFGAELISVE